MMISVSSETGLDARGLRARLVRIASEAGAGAVAVASAAADPKARQRFDEAIARGDIATWPYDADYAARSTSPQTLLPGARSVVCVAIPYASEAPKQRAPLTGRVSTYAWGEDYHRHVRAVLERIAAELDALAGEPATRVVCDTAPFAERAFAERSGLGWVGKHANLIAPGAGSFVFLGEIVTTLEIAPDAPSKKSCGSCTRCVDVCPTRALRGDYTMDSTRCIADLTQRTDGIPREMRALVGDWIWGCDLCQDVCPPTRGAPRAPPTVESEAAYPDLVALLSLRSGAYKREYRSRAIGWRGAAVLRRNAAVALGNALDRSAVPALERALAEDPHSMVRGHIAWALGRIGSPRARSALRSAQASEAHPGVLEEITFALERFENGR